MFKKIFFFTAMFIFITTVLYAQIATPGLYTSRSFFPTPRDPVKCQTMQLKEDDLILKQNAENYMREGKKDLAITELMKISDAWVSHWLLSYLYEADSNLRDALAEVNWLIEKNKCRTLGFELNYRKERIEKTISSLENWKNRWDEYPHQPDKKGVWLGDF